MTSPGFRVPISNLRGGFRLLRGRRNGSLRHEKRLRLEPSAGGLAAAVEPLVARGLSGGPEPTVSGEVPVVGERYRIAGCPALPSRWPPFGRSSDPVSSPGPVTPFEAARPAARQRASRAPGWPRCALRAPPRRPAASGCRQTSYRRAFQWPARRSAGIWRSRRSASR